jgi:dTDP-4-dehydrorhamnose reductase
MRDTVSYLRFHAIGQAERRSINSCRYKELHGRRMTIRILLLGSEGNVGWELQRALAPLGELTARSRMQCDLLDAEALRRTIESTRPDVIVNAAAYTAVDKAEQDAATAEAINATAVGLIAAAARANGALFVHFSTDYVFDGSKSGWYVETDATGPRSEYGRGKQRGEQAIVASGCRHLIFRTSWVFATRGANFAKTMLRLAGERETLRVIADQWGAPTGAELIADVTAHAIREVVAGRAAGGLYHLAAAGETSWHEYASFVVEEARRLGAELRVRTIEAITTDEYPLPAPRPANSRLGTEKLQAAFGLRLPEWQYHVRRMLTELLGIRA